MSRKRRRFLRRAGWNLLGVLVMAVMCFPVYWMVSTAFKTGPNILTFTPEWFPIPATLDNFQDAIARPFFWRSVLNSVIVVAVVVTLSIVLAFVAALALAKFRFYGRRGVVVTLIGVQMVPLTALIIPLYILISTVDKAPLKVNTLGGLIVTYLTFVLPFAVWTLRGFLMGIPRELEEAAMVDGSSRFGAFVRILLPLVAPGIVATSIFAFIQVWNEFILAYVLLSGDEKQTLQIWLAAFTGTSRGVDWGALMAGATLAAVPAVVFFMMLHRRIAFGLTAGAVRG
jgi:N,N'-diacetylchitobiose transport system permease protein